MNQVVMKNRSTFSEIRSSILAKESKNLIKLDQKLHLEEALITIWPQLQDVMDHYQVSTYLLLRHLKNDLDVKT